MITKRTTITIPETLYTEAERLMREQHFGDFSGFIQHLIRAENERRINRSHELAEKTSAVESKEQPTAAHKVKNGKSSSKLKEKVA